MDDKIIVTNRGALTRKYGAKGLAAIRKALSGLIAEDKKRGIKTAVLYLDDGPAMKKLGAKPVSSPTAVRETKNAIDKIYASLQPDYVLILGAPDVVPHQDLNNPAFGAGDDDNRAWGDVPYACDVPYSRDPAHFVGPTRVVGRLPDLMGAKEPSYLIDLIGKTAKWQSRPASDYTKYFGLSAEVWKGSTQLSLENIFGHAEQMLLSPKSGPKYLSGELGARMHFINCHGALAAPEFYGQSGTNFPVSLTTPGTKDSILDGTVAAVECCYGGELYDSVTLSLAIPICQSYLQQGAYAYLGSTTIAYGPADDNGAADLICQFFLLNLLEGASTGRAALVARQQFVERNAQMDPIDLKTLAQFCLYGDPSVHPVAQQVQPGLPKGVAADNAERFFRSERRAKLKLTGEFLQKTKPTASKQQVSRKMPANVKTTLANIAKNGGLPAGQKFTAFKVKGSKAPKGGAAKLATAPSRYYVAVGCGGRTAGSPACPNVAVVAKEVADRIIGYRIYHAR
jgi:hypothetical protein